MAAVNRHNINVGIITALTNAAAVTALIGNPPRVYTRTPRHVTYPWLRVDSIPNRPKFVVISGSGPLWIRTANTQFSAFSLKTSASEVAAIQAAVADVMDAAVSTVTFTGGVVVMSLLVVESMPYEVETGWDAVSEYELTVQPS